MTLRYDKYAKLPQLHVVLRRPFSAKKAEQQVRKAVEATGEVPQAGGLYRSSSRGLLGQKVVLELSGTPEKLQRWADAIQQADVHCTLERLPSPDDQMKQANEILMKATAKQREAYEAWLYKMTIQTNEDAFGPARNP